MGSIGDLVGGGGGSAALLRSRTSEGGGWWWVKSGVGVGGWGTPEPPAPPSVGACGYVCVCVCVCRHTAISERKARMGLRVTCHNEGALCVTLPSKGELPAPSRSCTIARARASVRESVMSIPLPRGRAAPPGAPKGTSASPAFSVWGGGGGPAAFSLLASLAPRLVRRVPSS